MSNLSQFLGGGGGGLTPKFQEFTSSGTFTPSQALIDAGGYIEVFLVAGGGGGSNTDRLGAGGGETFIKSMYLTTTSNISVTIGAGGNASNGSNSSFNGSSAGGTDLTAKGGNRYGSQDQQLGATFGGYNDGNSGAAAGSGILGYGGGAHPRNYTGGISIAKANSGQGSTYNQVGGSGYCLVKWYE